MFFVDEKRDKIVEILLRNTKDVKIQLAANYS